jgi:hypothetical protein
LLSRLGGSRSVMSLTKRDDGVLGEIIDHSLAVFFAA